MARGRKAMKLPIDYIRYLHSQGLSVRTIAAILERQLGIRVHYSTIARRLQNEKLYSLQSEQ